MEELKPAEILKAVHTCGSSFCTTDRHECPYGDEGCIDCVDRLEADFEALIIAGDDLIIRHAEPENELTCAGCVHNDPAGDAPWPEICYECKRQSRQDMYRNKPEEPHG